ncbi:MAG TPA: OmpA family protein [Verrucomicrobiales bacterium]|nr:OmpA family protein [Verrucomicrobiales bacterium]
MTRTTLLLRSVPLLFFPALLLAFAAGCSGLRKKGGDPYGPGEGDPLNYAALPPRMDGVSLYGPGSENVQRDPVEPVYFAFDSSVVDLSEMPKVERLAGIARSTYIIIAGHTDEVGTFEYNRALGERRAMAVRAELLNMGVPAQNIQTLSYGEDYLTGQGDYYDRRAEFGAVIQR